MLQRKQEKDQIKEQRIITKEKNTSLNNQENEFDDDKEKSFILVNDKYKVSLNKMKDKGICSKLNSIFFKVLLIKIKEDKEFDLSQKNLLDLFEEKEKQEIGKIKPELQKFILPKSLFDNTKNKKKEISDDLNENKLKAKPYIPSKYKLNKKGKRKY